MTDQDHPINKAINKTVFEIIKSLKICFEDKELKKDDQIRAATIAMSEAINSYKRLLCEMGLEITYSMLLQHFLNLQVELDQGRNPKDRTK